MPSASEAVAATTRVTPSSAREAADALREADRHGRTVRFMGGGTKSAWGAAPALAPDVVLETRGLDRIVEHNAADLTAVLEAGVPLARAQATFAEAGQMLSLDPPDGDGRATIGGVLATGDSGPIRHRYGGIRDLVLGIRVALADGTLARAGGKVIKNVAGYDLGKLFAGSFGVLGLVVEVVVRLHPAPPRRASAIGRSDDPQAMQRAALSLARAPLELEGLDVRWAEGGGAVLVRAAGVAPEERLSAAADLMEAAGLEAGTTDDDEAWKLQRGGQRAGPEGAVVRVSGVRSELARVVGEARRVGGEVVGRAGFGLCWIRLPAAGDGAPELIEDLRSRLEPRPCVVLDAPPDVRRALDVWGPVKGLALTRRIKERFDPNGTCNPGIFVGGL